MISNKYPYDECSSCKTLSDCPYRVVMEDGRGSVFPPEDCPFPMDRLKEISKHKRAHNVNPN